MVRRNEGYFVVLAESPYHYQMHIFLIYCLDNDLAMHVTIDALHSTFFIKINFGARISATLVSNCWLNWLREKRGILGPDLHIEALAYFIKLVFSAIFPAILLDIVNFPLN